MQQLVGIGLYDSREAARLAGTRPATIRRWLEGYDRAGQSYPPLWEPALSGEQELVLDFRDLMEIRAVVMFRQRKVGLQTMRKAIRRAAQIVGHDRPLSSLAFKTDGARIFFEEVDPESGEPRIEDLFTGQREMRTIIERTLHNIDYEQDVPGRWWPMGRRARVMVDPRRSFGQPIEAETFIPTRTLALAAEAEGNAAKAAQVFEIPIAAVNRAVRFERDFAAAA